MFSKPRVDYQGIFWEGKTATRRAKKIAAKPWPSGQEITCREALKPHPGQGQNKNASFSRNGFYYTKIDGILKQKRHLKHLLQKQYDYFFIDL